jgi:hypothetical protein
LFHHFPVLWLLTRFHGGQLITRRTSLALNNEAENGTEINEIKLTSPPLVNHFKNKIVIIYLRQLLHPFMSRYIIELIVSTSA